MKNLWYRYLKNQKIAFCEQEPVTINLSSKRQTGRYSRPEPRPFDDMNNARIFEDDDEDEENDEDVLRKLQFENEEEPSNDEDDENDEKPVLKKKEKQNNPSPDKTKLKPKTPGIIFNLFVFFSQFIDTLYTKITYRYFSVMYAQWY